MPRVKDGTVARKRRKKILELTKSYRDSEHLQFGATSTQLFVSYEYAFRDRRKHKSEFRELWIVHINTAARQDDLSCSKSTHGLKVAGIDINRKMLADITYNDEKAFTKLATTAKKALD